MVQEPPKAPTSISVQLVAHRKVHGTEEGGALVLTPPVRQTAKGRIEICEAEAQSTLSFDIHIFPWHQPGD